MKEEIKFHFDNKIVWLRGLMVECPMGDPADDCPLQKFRLLPLTERMKIVNQMTTKNIDKILAHHTMCLNRREA